MKDDSLVRRHDDYQFEVKLGYDLKRRNRKDRYRVETFIFLPENLDVNDATYSKKQFYRDLLLYIRFRTPEIGLSALTDAAEARSPLNRLPEKLETMRRTRSAGDADATDYELRLFGCVLKNALRAHLRKVEDLVYGGGAAAAVGALVDDYADQARRAAARYRSFKDAFTADPAVPDRIKATYGFVDEYLSLMIEGQTHGLLQSLQNSPAAAALAPRLAALADVIRAETEHRRRSGIPSLVETNADNETFIFRLSVLKKFVFSALHLSLRTEKEGRGVEQAALAIGAGVAMAFFIAVTLYYEKKFGAVSMSFTMAVIVAYIFRERIKDMVQERLRGMFAKNLFDTSTNIFDPLDGDKIGLCRESFAFVSEKRLDPMVLRLRSRDHITDIENTYRSEKVIHYVKEITLLTRRFLKNKSRKVGLTDILRFNLRNFLLKMDEPMAKLFVLKDGRSGSVDGSRVYHVNMVIKFISQEHVRYERIRLVLNRNGIKRIEPVSSEILPPTEK